MEGIGQRRLHRPAETLPSQSDQGSAPKCGQFPYGDMFLLSLLPPGIVLLAFGGRPMLIALCFGSMLTYIFDIFGAMEVGFF